MSARRLRLAAWAAALVVTVGGGLCLSACGSAAPTPSTSPTATHSEARRGGMLTIGYPRTPASLDPVRARSPEELLIVRTVYEPLFRYQAVGSAGRQLEPCLAAELPSRANGGLDETGTIYTIGVRRGARFQPPLLREITADDVRYSLERMLRLASPTMLKHYANIVGVTAFRQGKRSHVSGIEVIDESTLQVHLIKPDATFTEALADVKTSVLAREWVDEKGIEFRDQPLGTGPFMLVKRASDDSLLLSRNPQYWRQGEPLLDTIKCLTVEPTRALDSLAERKIDLWTVPLSEYDLARVAAAPTQTTSLHWRPLPQAVYLAMNRGSRPLADARVRRALAAAIDRQALCDAPNAPLEPLTICLPPAVARTDVRAPAAAAQPAAAILSPPAAGQRRARSLTLIAPRGLLTAAQLNTLRRGAVAAGLRLDVAVLDEKQYRRRLTKPAGADLALVEVRTPVSDLRKWVSTVARTPLASGDAQAFRLLAMSPELRQMLANATASTDPQQQAAACTELVPAVQRHATCIPLFSRREAFAASADIGGFSPFSANAIDLAGYWRQ